MAADLARAPAGTFQGISAGSVTAWRGIRYGQAARFAVSAAVPAAAGVQVCDRFGACAPQTSHYMKVNPVNREPPAEDCLFLNIYSPAADEARRPVMVWIHGGGFVMGEGAFYDGADLAARGDIVVVTVNYRLGVLGFTDLSDLGVPRNLGLRDQILALEWIRENIASFGGDPDRVTLAGESAGSFSVSLLMLASAANGLFHGAILQSGAVNLVHDAAAGQELARRHRRQLGDHGRDLSALRSAPLARILEAQDAVSENLDGTVAAGPIWDGDLLPSSLQDARKTSTSPIPMIAGWMRDETRLFELKALRTMVLLARAKVLDRIERQFGAATKDRIDAAYPTGKAGDRALATDANFAQPTLNVVERHASAGNPTWVYRFDRGGLMLGAAHGLELSYLWPILGISVAIARGGPLVGGRRRLAERLRADWVSFVKSGEPGANWPRYLPDDRSIRLYDRRDTIMRDPEAKRREAWRGLDVGITEQDVGFH